MLVCFIYHIVYIYLRIPSPLLLSCLSFLLSTGIFISTFCVILFIECITQSNPLFLVFHPLMLCFLFFRFPLFCPLLITSNSHPNFQSWFLPFLSTTKVCSHSFLLNVNLCTQFQKASKHVIEPFCHLVSDNKWVGITFPSSQSFTIFLKKRRCS